MGWKVHSEEKDHFVVHGNSGPFRIGKQNLSEGGLVKLRSFLQGNKKPGTTEEREKNEVEEQGFAQGTPDAPVADYEPRENVNPAFPQYETEGSAPRAAPAPPPQETEVEPSTGAPITTTPPDETSRELGRIFSTGNPADEAFQREQSAAASRGPAQPPPDSIAVRPGEPGGPPMPQQPRQQQGGQDFQLPPLPPMTDLTKVAQESKEAQESGGRAADTLRQAESAQAAAMVQHYQRYNDGIQQIHDHLQSDLQSISARNEKMISDLMDPKSDIKPEHFWAEKSTFQKVVAGLGMLLSGIGSGLSGQPNMAMQFIQKAIDRDIEAQKANLGKKESAVSYGMKLFGNKIMAADYARGMLTNTLAAAVGMEGARTGDLRARAQAEMTKSQLAMQALQPQLAIANIRHQDQMMRYQMDFQRKLFELAGGGGGQPQGNYIPSSAHPPMLTEFSPKGIADKNKDDNERRVNLPMLGQGTYTHAQTPKDAEDSKKTLATLDNIDRQLGTLKNTAGDNPFALHIPGSGARGTYQSFASSLVTELNKLQDLNRLNGNEYKEFGSMIPTEREWLTPAGEAKAAALKQHVENKRQEEFQVKLGLRRGSRPQQKQLGAP